MDAIDSGVIEEGRRSRSRFLRSRQLIDLKRPLVPSLYGHRHCRILLCRRSQKHGGRKSAYGFGSVRLSMLNAIFTASSCQSARGGICAEVASREVIFSPRRALRIDCFSFSTVIIAFLVPDAALGWSSLLPPYRWHVTATATKPPCSWRSTHGSPPTSCRPSGFMSRLLPDDRVPPGEQARGMR